MYPCVRLYQGELLQGAAGRLAEAYSLGYRQLNRKLFGINGQAKRARSALDIRLPQAWLSLWSVSNPTQFLREHTLMGMFTWRVNYRRQVPLSIRVCPSTTWELRIPYGFASSRYKFCPQCWREQWEKFGELHWDTLCQVPGVNICLTHRVPLRETDIRLDGRLVPYELGYILPRHVEGSYELPVDDHSLLIANTARELLERSPSRAVTIPEWLAYLCHLMKSEVDEIGAQYRLLESAKMHKLVKLKWGSDYGADIRWLYPLANLKDFRWWGWLKLLRIISPQKKLVNALRECIRWSRERLAGS